MDTKNIRARGRPPVDSDRVTARFPRHLLDALDQFIREEHPDVSRPEGLRIAFRDWAIAHGYLELPPEREDAN